MHNKDVEEIVISYRASTDKIKLNAVNRSIVKMDQGQIYNITNSYDKSYLINKITRFSIKVLLKTALLVTKAHFRKTQRCIEEVLQISEVKIMFIHQIESCQSTLNKFLE